MKSAWIAIGVVLLLATAGATPTLAQGNIAKEQKVVAEAAWVPSDTSVMDKVWFLFIDKPQQQMRSTLVHLSRQEQDEAAVTVLTTAAYMRLETLRAHGAELTGLQRAIGELDKLAEQISLGKVTKPEEVAKPFDDALLALARFHYGQAQRALARVDNREFGKELKATVAMLDFGLSSNKEGLDPVVLNDFTETRSVADSLVTGDVTRPDDGYSDLMTHLRTDIDLLAKLSHDVQPVAKNG